jgi:UDP-N-acetylmuramyl pentapeptide phosphotransferase/UDP-N-acetylglucosamine-1-phosphate transferase
MLYYLAKMLMPHFSVLNVLTYHTVRAGGAALTGFIFCVLVGPRIIRMLQRLKVGQHIKEDHVADLHALHKSKAATPTMGGVMIIVSTVLTLLLWSTLTNHLLLVAVGVFVLLGAVGFVDDYIKLRRKHNDGLSARAKLGGQILAGLILGVWLVCNPITYQASYLRVSDIVDWQELAALMTSQEGREDSADVLQVREVYSQSMARSNKEVTPNTSGEWLLALNTVLEKNDLYREGIWDESLLGREALGLLARDGSRLSKPEVLRRNRLLLEATLPIERSHQNLHTSVGVPGLKNMHISMGYLYIFFVILVIVSVSNAVNLTDGLDGLAAGTSVISILTFAAIAYVVSRADWSQYLYLSYIPEASELFVFGGALLGTGLGFLWFNAHPAEVFMGDTGSLALGGAIATMAILTKQELLLPIVGGIFVLEAGSVVVQVASYKLTGKRVFRMAPLHHHFELLGWAETKVTLRFWIVALLFALMSLGTLKLR